MELFGDAQVMIDSTGGNDLLKSNDGDNTLYGDAREMAGTSPDVITTTGGNDILISGKGSDIMYGDAEIMDASTTGGNDILKDSMGGPNGGNDILVGNGGHDKFKTGGNINAQILDYNPGEGDKIAGALHHTMQQAGSQQQ